MFRAATSFAWFTLAVVGAPYLVYLIDGMAGYRWTEAAIPHDMAVFAWGVWICGAVAWFRETWEKARGA